MALISPIIVGTTALIALPRSSRRATVRFQNTGTTTLYFTRQPSSTVITPSSTSYSFILYPSTASAEELERSVTVRSGSQFNVVSSAAGGTLAIMETVYI